MLVIDDIIVSDDLYLVRFCCDLPRCHGICCVEGDAGAPLTEEEISLLEDHIDDIIPFMTLQGRKAISWQGVFDYDAFGKFVTPLVEDTECVYCSFRDDGVAYCAIQKAFEEGKIAFEKPLSCHLYPVRISDHDNFEAVNYHKWHICRPALKKGRKEGLMLYEFLKDSLTRKYGQEWYEKLDIAIRERLKEQG
jgi:hypothetical protein